MTVNPYKMEVTPSGGTATTDQIISAPQFIKNESNVDINIDATVTGEIPQGSEAVFATNTVANTVTTKSVFLYFEIATATSTSTAPTWAAAYDAKSAAMIPVATKATTKKDVIKMGKKDTNPTYAGFHLAGNAATNPTKAWKSDDKVNVKIAFTIRPAVATTATP